MQSVLKYIHEPVENNIVYIDNLPRVEITKALSKFDGFSLQPSTIIIFVKHPDGNIIPINATNKFRKRYKKFTEKRLIAAKETMPVHIHIHIAKIYYTVWQEDLNDWFVRIEEKAYKKLLRPCQTTFF